MPRKELDPKDIHKRFDSDVAQELLRLMKRGYKVTDGSHYILIYCPCPVKAKPTKVSTSKSGANLSRVRGAASKCPNHPELQG